MRSCASSTSRAPARRACAARRGRRCSNGCARSTATLLDAAYAQCDAADHGRRWRPRPTRSWRRSADACRPRPTSSHGVPRRSAASRAPPASGRRVRMIRGRLAFSRSTSRSPPPAAACSRGIRGRSCSCGARSPASASRRASSGRRRAWRSRRPSRCCRASPDRRAVAGDWRCGGNVLAHVAYERQRQLKGEIIRDAFGRIGRMPLDAIPRSWRRPSAATACARACTR